MYETNAKHTCHLVIANPVFSHVMNFCDVYDIIIHGFCPFIFFFLYRIRVPSAHYFVLPGFTQMTGIVS